MTEIAPITGFSFNPNPILAQDPPEPIYIVRASTEFEVCNIKGLRKGTKLEMIKRLNGSPQGINSRWVITNIRLDIDKISIKPVEAKAGIPGRSITLKCLKDHFVPIGLLEYKVRHA